MKCSWLIIIDKRCPCSKSSARTRNTGAMMRLKRSSSSSCSTPSITSSTSIRISTKLSTSPSTPSCNPSRKANSNSIRSQRYSSFSVAKSKFTASRTTRKSRRNLKIRRRMSYMTPLSRWASTIAPTKWLSSETTALLKQRRAQPLSFYLCPPCFMKRIHQMLTHAGLIRSCKYC